jgi:hypothetical protein
MKEGLGMEAKNFTDGDGVPVGGWVAGPGVLVNWASDRGGGEQYGVGLVDVLRVLIERVEYYQATAYRCEEYRRVLVLLSSAKVELELAGIERRQRVKMVEEGKGKGKE